MRHRSNKTAKFYREERVPLTKEILEIRPWCELANQIRQVSPDWDSCFSRAIGLHERRKRSQGGSMLNRANVLPTCGPCNSWVEDNPRLAHSIGLVVRQGDEEYDILGSNR